MLPIFAATMINNTFDWGFWLVLGIFAEFFGIPALPAQEVELLFADPRHRVPAAASKPLRDWLSGYGFTDNATTPRAGDVFYSKVSASPMARSAVYVSTFSAPDTEFSSDDLVRVVATDKFGGGDGGGHSGGPGFGGGGAPSAGVCKERKIAKHIAKVVRVLSRARAISLARSRARSLTRYASLCFSRSFLAPLSLSLLLARLALTFLFWDTHNNRPCS